MIEQQTYQINPEILLFMHTSSGMSEDEIAKKLKLSRSKYLSIENGAEKISQNHLIDSYRKGDLTNTSLSTITGVKDKWNP